MDGSYGSPRPSRDRWHSVMLGIGSTIRQVRRDSWWTWSCRTSSGPVHRSVSRGAWEPPSAGGRREAMTSRSGLWLHVDWRRFLVSWFALPAAALAALLIGAGMLLVLGANPLTGYRALLEGAFGSFDSLVNTAIKAVPLVLVGVGICIAFRTIVLNIVAVQIMNYLLSGPLVDKSFSGFSLIPQTKRLSPNTDLPVLVGGTHLHAGVIVAVLAAVAAYVLLWRTGFGFRLRAVGLSREASGYAGMPVKRTITLALTLSGAMAGLAGAVLVFGSASHRMVTDGTATGFTGSAGFNGIVAALFGGLNPLWTMGSAFVFGGLLVGGNAMQIAVQVPTALIVALNGLLVVFVVSIEYVRRRSRLHQESPREAAGAGSEAERVGAGPSPSTERIEE